MQRRRVSDELDERRVRGGDQNLKRAQPERKASLQKRGVQARDYLHSHQHLPAVIAALH